MKIIIEFTNENYLEEAIRHYRNGCTSGLWDSENNFEVEQ